MVNSLTPGQWEQFQRDGYVILGQLLDADGLAKMQGRLDDIMLGRADIAYDRMVMQLEGETGEYNKAGPQTRGFKKATLNYRVVYGLEHDPIFLAYTQRPIFHDICKRVYGDIDIGSYRAFVMNKPARGGSLLGWHQDRWSFLTPDPLITLWTALDPATIANGCVQVIRGSHLAGPINPAHESGFITADQTLTHCAKERLVYLELKAGEVALLHNWLLHRSDINQTDKPRRGFSVCYLDARTVDSRPAGTRDHLYDSENMPVIFGANALRPELLRA